MDRSHLWAFFGCLMTLAVVETLALRPVLIVPGFQGSVLEWRDPTQDDQDSWERCWVSPLIWVEHMEKWMAGMKTVYDPVSDTFANNTEEIRPVGFGDVTGVSVMDSWGLMGYFDSFVTALEGLGYKPGVTVRAAPYDWRIAPWHPQMQEWRDSVTALIEEMYEQSNSTPVVIVSHSLGGVTMSKFLAEKDASWKSQFIDHFVSIAAPLGGAVSALTAVVSGYDFGVEIWGTSPLPYHDLRDVCRTWGSAVGMFPNTDFGAPLVIAGSDVYNLTDIVPLLTKCGATQSVAMMPTSYTPPGPLPAPGVPTYCLVGTGHDTVVTLKYDRENLFTEIPQTDSADGDGTVLFASASRCKEWDDGKTPFTFQLAPGATHHHIVSQQKYWNDMLQTVIMRP